MIRVEYSVFNDKYNQRDVRARENMHDLIESDANKVTKAVAAVKRSTGRISLFDTMQDSEE